MMLPKSWPDGNSHDEVLIPCSEEWVKIEFIQPDGICIDTEVIKHAAAAVLHYFRLEMGRTTVTLGEFSLALEQALRGLGFHVKANSTVAPSQRVAEADLQQLVCDSGQGFELVFFPRLRQEMRQQLSHSPRIIRFMGLRSCVKRLVGARRWTHRCQRLNDHIVDYLRLCLTSEVQASDCALVVE